MAKLLVTKNPQKAGFSLLELTIVLTIVGILLYATVSVGLSQIGVAKVKATQDKMDRINTALTVYYKTNGYLPCPADGTNTIAGAPTTYGKSQGSGSPVTSCSNVLANSGATLYIGTVPARTLNLSDDYMFDSWGNRITYIVSKTCLDSTKWVYLGGASSGQKLCASGGTAIGNDAGVLQMKDKGGTLWPQPYAAYVTISHGKDGYGAWSRSGTRVLAASACQGGGTLEQINGNLQANCTSAYASGNAAISTIYYDASFNDGTTTSYFDDIVRWRTSPQIDYDANH